MTTHMHKGDKLCDLCQKDAKDTFYDAFVPRYRTWGNLCRDCFSDEGCNLGTGRGQRYSRQPDGTWIKTAG